TPSPPCSTTAPNNPVLTATFTATLTDPWPTMDPLPLGPAAPRTPDAFVLVELSGHPHLRLDLYRHPEEYRGFERAAPWHDRLVIGWGEHVHLVWPERRTHRTIPLHGAHFCGFELDDDRLYVASSERVLRVDPDGFVRWTSDPVGIDGVLIHRVTRETIEGDGERDPPGGWVPFTLHAGTGALLLTD
ncbi:MAG: hypothetical protein KDK70_43015, partial [Myxococcales bacterium]|nr:hypothetical protein [Myxococcales bacterium]